ncbi:hypothetical protein SALBM217S_03139 [Streptomyces griseoloalbus]
MWLLVVLCAVLGACGPASMIGFDFARPANPPERQGTASGITNMGGFVASMTTLFAVGVLLDATGDDNTGVLGGVRAPGPGGRADPAPPRRGRTPGAGTASRQQGGDGARPRLSHRAGTSVR